MNQLVAETLRRAQQIAGVGPTAGPNGPMASPIYARPSGGIDSLSMLSPALNSAFAHRDDYDAEQARRIMNSNASDHTYMSGLGPRVNPLFRNEIKAEFKEGDNMDNATVLYEVLIIDSREAADDDAVTEVYVRAKSREEAKLLAILRTEQGESDIPFLDFAVKAIESVKPVVASGEDA